MARAKANDRAIDEVANALRELEFGVQGALNRSGTEVRVALGRIEGELKQREGWLSDARERQSRAVGALHAFVPTRERPQPPPELVARAQQTEEEVREASASVERARASLKAAKTAEAAHNRIAARAKGNVLGVIPAAQREVHRASREIASYSAGTAPGFASGAASAGSASDSGLASGGRRGGSSTGSLSDLERIELSRVDTSEIDEDGPGSFEKITPDDAVWSANALSSVVAPAVAMGKGREYFEDRDRREGRSGERTYAKTYDGYYGASGIKVSDRGDGSYEVDNGRHRVWAARKAGLSWVPGRIRR